MDFNANAAATLHVDTVRIYGKVKWSDIHTHPNYKPIGYDYNYNIRNYLLIVPETNYTVRVTHTFGMVYFEFSLSRLVYPDNSQLLTVGQAKAAIQRLSELAGLPLENFSLTRLDITHNINFKPTSLLFVQPQLAAPKYHLPKPTIYRDKTGKRNGNVLFQSKPVTISSISKTKRSKKATEVYEKGEKTRVETRLFSATTIKATLGLADTDLKLEHLLTEAFAELSDRYYTKIVSEMTSKNPEHKLVKGFKKAALEGISTGLLH